MNQIRLSPLSGVAHFEKPLTEVRQEQHASGRVEVVIPPLSEVQVELRLLSDIEGPDHVRDSHWRSIAFNISEFEKGQGSMPKGQLDYHQHRVNDSYDALTQIAA